MTKDDFNNAISYLCSLSNTRTLTIPSNSVELGAESQLILPHKSLPGSILGGTVWPDVVTEENWKDYRWNPPQYTNYTTQDQNASPKPTWEMLVSARNAYRISELRTKLLSSANNECSRRIVLAYNAKSWTDEIETRLRNETTLEQDLERDRLLNRCRALKTKINNAQTIDVLESIDIYDDVYWS